MHSHLLSRIRKIKINKSIIFHVVLFERETWPLTRRGKHRLKASENRSLKRITESKKEEMKGGWRLYEGNSKSKGIIGMISLYD